MSNEVKHLKDALRQLMVEEIFAEIEKGEDDNINLDFQYGTEHYCDLDAVFDEDGKCTDIFINIQYEDEGLIYDTTSGLWDLGLSELNEVYKRITEE